MVDSSPDASSHGFERSRFARLRRRLGLVFGMVALVLLLWAVYAISPVKTSFDSRWSIHMAMSFLRGDWGDLTAFQPILEHDSYFAVENSDGRITSIFPIGVSVLSIPAVALAQWLNPTFYEQIRYAVPVDFEGLLAAFYAALTGAVFFWAVLRRHGSMKIAIFTGLLFCFATPMWSTASRALWQHGPQMLMFTIALALLVEARLRPHLVQYLGFVMAWAYIIRPTSSLEVAGLTLYVAVCHRRWLLRYLLGAMIVAVPWTAYNFIFYDNILPPYYWPQRLVSFRFYEALSGHWISPARGVLVYSPVLLLAVPGMVLALRQRTDRWLHLGMVVIIIAHWLVVSRFRHWWGGFSYGPRLMTDIMPLIVWFIPFALPLQDRLTGAWRTAAVSTVGVLTAVSVWMHAQGAWSGHVYTWNETPVDIDHSPERLWSWSDPPFLRGLMLPNAGAFHHMLAPQPDVALPLPYRLGDEVMLAGNPSLLGRRRGWSATEPWGVWTQGPRATFALRLAEPATGDLELSLQGRAFLSPIFPRQEVEVRVNGVSVARWVIRDGDGVVEWKAMVPAGVSAGTHDIAVDLLIASPVSPVSLGLSSDPRQLGLGIASLRLTPIP